MNKIDFANFVQIASNLYIKHWKFRLSKRIAFYQKMCSFIESKISVYDALSKVKLRLQEVNDPQWKMIEEWTREMRRGANLSDAIKDWIPESEYMLIAAGERGGRLLDGLNEAITLSLAMEKMTGAIKRGLTMPVVLLILFCGMLSGFDVFMAPIFESMLPINLWPSDAQNLYALSHFVATKWWIVLLMGFALGLLITKTIHTWRGGWRSFFDKIPPWSLYKRYQAASFLVSLASLLKAGISFNDALKTINQNASPWLKDHVNIMMARLRRGGLSLGECMDTGLFEKEMAGDIIDYSSLSSFEETVYRMGTKMVEDGTVKVTASMGVVQNIMLALVAGVLMWTFASGYSLQSYMGEAMERRQMK